MEIYNETLYDMLSDNPAASDNLAILDDANNTMVSSRCTARASADDTSWDSCLCSLLQQSGRSGVHTAYSCKASGLWSFAALQTLLSILFRNAGAWVDKG
eukprot:GHUV01038606.1.p2 GENE.GHUV01038606.1~~GHUV01038606.1.p2  ORF type:complete len:100 (-),score=25.32 GHUV01038606.1:65-364(-)